MITKVLSSSNKDNSNELNKKKETRNNTYVNNNNKNNKNNYPSYDKKNDFNNNDYYNKEKSSIKYNRRRNEGFIGFIFFIGSVLTFIWIALLILYCLVNRRKNTFDVVIKNIENNSNSRGYISI